MSSPGRRRPGPHPDLAGQRCLVLGGSVFVGKPPGRPRSLERGAPGRRAQSRRHTRPRSPPASSTSPPTAPTPTRCAPRSPAATGTWCSTCRASSWRPAAPTSTACSTCSTVTSAATSTPARSWRTTSRGSACSPGPRTSRRTPTGRRATAASRRWPRRRCSPATPRRGSRRSVVRPAAIYGPDNNIFDMETPMFLRLLQRRPILVPHGGLVVGSYGHVDDLCDAMITIARAPRGRARRGVQHLRRQRRREPLHPHAGRRRRRRARRRARARRPAPRAARPRCAAGVRPPVQGAPPRDRSAPRRRGDWSVTGTALRPPLRPRAHLRVVPVAGLRPARRSTGRPGVEGQLGLRRRGRGGRADPAMADARAASLDDAELWRCVEATADAACAAGDRPTTRRGRAPPRCSSSASSATPRARPRRRHRGPHRGARHRARPRWPATSSSTGTATRTSSSVAAAAGRALAAAVGRDDDAAAEVRARAATDGGAPARRRAGRHVAADRCVPRRARRRGRRCVTRSRPGCASAAATTPRSSSCAASPPATRERCGSSRSIRRRPVRRPRRAGRRVRHVGRRRVRVHARRACARLPRRTGAVARADGRRHRPTVLRDGLRRRRRPPGATTARCRRSSPTDFVRRLDELHRTDWASQLAVATSTPPTPPTRRSTGGTGCTSARPVRS